MDRDAGAMIRDGIKCMEKLGVCPEAVWKCLGVLGWMARDGVDGAMAGRWGAPRSRVSLLLFGVGLIVSTLPVGSMCNCRMMYE